MLTAAAATATASTPTPSETNENNHGAVVFFFNFDGKTPDMCVSDPRRPPRRQYFPYESMHPYALTNENGFLDTLRPRTSPKIILRIP